LASLFYSKRIFSTIKAEPSWSVWAEYTSRKTDAGVIELHFFW
jgi:hypothetical protein